MFDITPPSLPQTAPTTFIIINNYIKKLLLRNKFKNQLGSRNEKTGKSYERYWQWK